MTSHKSRENKEAKMASMMSDSGDSEATISVQFGDGEGSFFGLRIDPNTKYDVLLKANMCMSSFALDPTTMEEDENVTLWIKAEEEFALCSLRKTFPQYYAKLYFAKGSQFTLYLKGKGTGYVCGYKTAHAVYDSD